MEGTIGEIRYFAPNFAPKNWAFCQGQLLPIAQNQALAAVIGTIYGGDGKTTIALPDLQGRITVGMGTLSGTGSVYVQAQKGGLEGVALNVSQIPLHIHSTVGITQTVPVTPSGVDGTGDLTSPQGNYFAASDTIFNPDPTNGVFGGATAAAVTGSLTLQNAGTSAAHENRMPYACVNAIICLVGIFPSRN